MAGVAVGDPIRQITHRLGCSVNTVSREIKRNTWLLSNQSEAYLPQRLKTGP